MKLPEVAPHNRRGEQQVPRARNITPSGATKPSGARLSIAAGIGQAGGAAIGEGAVAAAELHIALANAITCTAAIRPDKVRRIARGRTFR